MGDRGHLAVASKERGRVDKDVVDVAGWRVSLGSAPGCSSTTVPSYGDPQACDIFTLAALPALL